MAKQVQVALLNFGIISSLAYRTSKNGFFHYLIQIYGENISLFNKKIGFGCTYKKERAEATEKIVRNTNKNIIPNQKNNVINMYHEIKKYNTYLNDKIYHVISGNNELTYNKLHDILDLNNIKESSEYFHFSDLEKQNYFFSKIVEIQDGENHVYDFSIPETHSFVSNGFVSHNTHGEVLISVVLCILYPGINIAMTAQTKENAASILSSKIKTEILKQFPLIENEIVKKSFSKSEAEIIFANGSSLDILANAQTSKGQRRTRINVEESALLNKELFEDALQPIVEIARYTCGQLSVVDPEEMNQQINFFTTAGWRGSDEFERNLTYVDLMAECNGEFVIGSDWHLACWYGRGSTKPQIMKKKSQMSPVAFDQNYGSKWTGNISGCLVDIKKLLATRTLENYEAEAEKGYDYVISVDVARSEKTSNNQSSIAVLKIIRSNSRIVNVDLVNLSTMSNALNFTKQAIEVKRMWHKFNNHGRVTAICVDANGLGRGLLEELMKEHIDPITRLLYPCFNTINTEDTPETTNSIKIMYAIVAQSIQSDILTTFIDMVDSGRLRLLIKKDNSDYDIKTDIEEQVVYINTDFLIEEIANLKLKLGNGTGKLAIEQIVRRIDKDRFSALIYGLWYIKSFESVVKTNDFDWKEYMFF
jgi:ribonucleoside-diphosphate reductase alpha chain